MQFDQLKRRDFIALLGGAAATPALLCVPAARAQQSRMPVIGYLYAGAPDANPASLSAFHKGLNETGYAEGRNLVIEYRWAHNDNARLPELAADLVHRQVAVIATPGSFAAAKAAKEATTTIPIVFQFGGDPVQGGLVASLNRPGGNITGISSMNTELTPKRVGFLHELLPGAARFAVLVNSNNPNAASELAQVQATAAASGRQIEPLVAGSNREIDTAFATLVEKRIDALLVTSDALFNDRRVQIVTLATYHRVPAIFPLREYAEVGGLMSYGSNVPDLFRQAGVYTGRVLNGEKPEDLPIVLASKFEFVINLQTAKALSLDVPPTLLARADEVIE
jgi:putative tryptophan/tyrosine transport system substrate-binding protein